MPKNRGAPPMSDIRLASFFQNFDFSIVSLRLGLELNWEIESELDSVWRFGSAVIILSVFQFKIHFCWGLLEGNKSLGWWMN